MPLYRGLKLLRNETWRDSIVTWTLRLIAATEGVWLLVAGASTPWFIKTPYGWGFLLMLGWVLVALIRPHLHMGWRLGAVLGFLGYNITIGLILAGPNPGNTSLVLLLALFATLFWGLSWGIVTIVGCLLATAAAAFGWKAQVLPLGGLAPSMDPHQMVIWVRGAMAFANGGFAVAIVVSTVVRQLARAAEDADHALEREKAAKAHYRELFERLPIGIFRTSVDGQVLAANPTLLTMLGFHSFAELAEVDLESSRFQPEYDRQSFKSQLERSGEIRGQDAVWRRRDGSKIHVRENARVVRDTDGKILYYEGTVEDITERKALEERLLQAQRLESIGTLASGVAHDLNNTLTPMLIASQLLEHKLPKEDQELAVMIRTGAQRGTDTIRKLLAFGRAPNASRQATQPAELLREITSIVRATFPSNIVLVERFSGALPWVVGESSQLYQVVMNLCVNARDVMENGGNLFLSAAEAPGDQVVISVEDTGPGIPPEIRARIFDPFFTTKELGRGTGLGLWSAYGVIKSYGGFITVECPPGRGALFKIFLPKTAAPTAVTQQVTAPAWTGEGRTVLVVDDEPAILAATKRVLERNGFTVLTALSGDEAIGVARIRSGKIRLVITDFMMPGMDGTTLMSHLRAMDPAIKFIGVSGLDRTDRKDLIGDHAFTAMLAKPYELQALLDAIKNALSKSDALVASSLN